MIKTRSTYCELRAGAKSAIYDFLVACFVDAVAVRVVGSNGSQDPSNGDHVRGSA